MCHGESELMVAKCWHFLMHVEYIMGHIHWGLLCLSFKNKYFVFTTQMQLCLLFRVCTQGPLKRKFT